MAEEVVQAILWTNLAKLSVAKIENYLLQTGSVKEAEKFINQTNNLLSRLRYYPEMCRPSAKRKNVTIAILNKHTQMVYRYRAQKKEIVILLFWGMRQDPKKFRY